MEGLEDSEDERVPSFSAPTSDILPGGLNSRCSVLPSNIVGKSAAQPRLVESSKTEQLSPDTNKKVGEDLTSYSKDDMDHSPSSGEESEGKTVETLMVESSKTEEIVYGVGEIDDDIEEFDCDVDDFKSEVEGEVERESSSDPKAESPVLTEVEAHQDVDDDTNADAPFIQLHNHEKDIEKTTDKLIIEDSPIECAISDVERGIEEAVILSVMEKTDILDNEDHICTKVVEEHTFSNPGSEEELCKCEEPENQNIIIDTQVKSEKVIPDSTEYSAFCDCVEKPILQSTSKKDIQENSNSDSDHCQSEFELFSVAPKYKQELKKNNIRAHRRTKSDTDLLSGLIRQLSAFPTPKTDERRRGKSIDKPLPYEFEKPNANQMVTTASLRESDPNEPSCECPGIQNTDGSSHGGNKASTKELVEERKMDGEKVETSSPAKANLTRIQRLTAMFEKAVEDQNSEEKRPRRHTTQPRWSVQSNNFVWRGSTYKFE